MTGFALEAQHVGPCHHNKSQILGKLIYKFDINFKLFDFMKKGLKFKILLYYNKRLIHHDTCRLKALPSKRFDLAQSHSCTV